MKIPKKCKKNLKYSVYNYKKPLWESEIIIIILYKTKSDEFPLCFLQKKILKNSFKKFAYLIRKENKYTERLKNIFNLSDTKNRNTYKNKKTFIKTIKDNGINLFKIAD